MAKQRVILENQRFNLMIDRLSHLLVENYNNFDNTCIIGVQPRGIFVANRIYQKLQSILGGAPIDYGKLDITFYRDDFRTRDKPLAASTTEIDFLVEGKKVLLVDDVLYTGRTIQSALTALQDFGRPEKVELVVLVDRRFNRHLPIQADYTGLTIDAIDEAYVKVEWQEQDGNDRILLFPHKV
jgi:pyrimidine operon attenuation protein/uracil phosphoribosyltransferase